MDKLDTVVVSTRVRLARNLKDIPFPAMLKGSQKSGNKVINIVTSACDQLFKYDLYRMSEIGGIDRLSLKESHLISPNLANSIENGAVCIGKNNDMSIMINEEDHVRAQCISKGFKLEECYKKVSAFDDKLSEIADIAYDEKLGFLTACPTNLGTGMRASVMLFLPALKITNALAGIAHKAQQSGLTVRGMYGEGSSGSGYLYQISNQITLGMSETDIIKNVQGAVMEICEAEEIARKNLFLRQRLEIEDSVCRSFGVLLYARKITTAEFMDHMANVKLGVALGVLNLNMSLLNHLTEVCQPANICRYCGRELNEQERDIERANLIRNKINER